MAELKRNFSGAKMNKDMDERILPSGQYRDANNIQIATSDGSDVGSLQSLYGNENMVPNSVNPDYSTCVGHLNLPEKDLIYYFVSGGGTFGRSGFTPLVKKDYIIEYNTNSKSHKFVFVDIFSAKVVVSENSTGGGNTSIKVAIGPSNTINKTGLRIGMSLSYALVNDPSSAASSYIGGADCLITDISYEAAGGGDPECWKVSLSGSAIPYFTTNDALQFTAPRVLNFNNHTFIPAINHIDGMLFWTDNHTEPKKINIKRSLYGTGGVAYLQGGGIAGYAAGAPTSAYSSFQGGNADFHTRLVTQSLPGSYRVCTNPAGNKVIWCREDHVTVIRKYPTQPLKLEMSTTEVARIDSSGNNNPTYASDTIDFTGGGQNGLMEVGDQITLTLNTPVDYREGDVIIGIQDTSNANPTLFAGDLAEIRLVCVDDNGASGNAPDLLTAGPMVFEVLSISENVPANGVLFHTRLEQSKALFEYKFVRFGYRWRYEDGEFSSFSPWSEIAFLPGDFDYLPQKGFNLGMKNQLRSLTLKDYFGEPSAVPEDVVGVDLLYKESNKSTVYTVKDITEKDGAPLWQDWKNGWNNRGEFQVETEMIHAVVPSNQILRQWDNVPRQALAQEISGNRLIFGNYLQNYDILKTPEIALSLSSGTMSANTGYDIQIAEKTCKSLRTYQVGVTFIDKYGRETPVMSSKKTGSLAIDKSGSPKHNRLQCKLTTDPPAWAKYFKYWVKETSNEYYNLAMDRFYAAEDGNIWLSFPSSERNKVDIETFLIMKKQHDNDEFVPDAARYKILALENSAPLFVKTEKKSMGTFNGLFSGAGQPKYNAIYIDIAIAAFHTAFGESDGDNPVSNLIGENNLFLKIRKGAQGGDWYKITGITKETSVYRVLLMKPLEMDVAFTQNSTTTPPDPTDPMETGLSMQIIQEVVINKPEFEGRFFAKIYKDLVLEKNLIANQEININWVVTQSKAIQRIRDWSKGESNHKTTWRNADGCRDRRGFFLDESSVMGGPGYAGGQVAGGSDNDWEDAWGNWDRADVIGPGFGGVGSNNQWQLSSSSTTNHPAGYRRYPPGGPDWDYGSGSDTGSGSNAYNGAHPTGMGLHSSGAVTSTPASEVDCMHISWTHTTPSGSNGNNSFWGPNQAGTNASSTDTTWIRTMCTVGTCFRWEGDTTIYEIIGNERGQTPGPIGGSAPGTSWSTKLENYDNQSGGDGNEYNEAGNKRTRYHLRFKPSMGFSTGNTVDYQPGGYLVDQPITDYDPRTHDSSGNANWWNSTWDVQGSGGEKRTIEIVENFVTEEIAAEFTSTNPAIWETEPKEDVGLDIYYEASRAIPIDFDHTTNEQLIPIGSWFMIGSSGPYKVQAWNDDEMTFTPNATVATADTNQLWFRIYNGEQFIARINKSGGIAVGDNTSAIAMGRSPIGWGGGSRASHATHHCTVKLAWHNAWAYGNGVESDRIRDDFNAQQVDNGVKASTTMAEQYKEERRSSGMIFSGIFNSTSGINRLNQFIQAEPITKDINPVHGTIQKLYSRNTDTLCFCEDKILNILTNKDAVFNADGKTNITSNQMVLGQATPILGDIGISTNPESFAFTPRGIYFADQMRGQVGYLQGNNAQIISDHGMKDWFNDNFLSLSSLMGTFDDKKKEYNITLGKKNNKEQFRQTGLTLSYNEKTKGWTSFKSFVPEDGTSLNNEYYTWEKGLLYLHHKEKTEAGVDINYNYFYGNQYYSDVTLIFNDKPGSVKNFGSLNYEGSQCAITPFTSTSTTNASGDTWNITDLEYYDLWLKNGWFVERINTNLQDGVALEFKNKEDKWFSTIKGVATQLSNLDEKEFSVQGIGVATTETTGEPDKGADMCFCICNDLEGSCNSGMDVAFILDYTGSMGGMVEDCKTGIGNIVDAIEVMADGEDYRLSLTVSDEQYTTSDATYLNDSGYTALPSAQKDVNTTGTRDIYTTVCEMFGTNNESSLTTQLNLLNTSSFPLGSGVGGPEPTDVALDMVGLNDFGGTWRSGVAKYVIVMTDAIMGGFDDLFTSTDTTRMNALASGLIADGIKAIIIGPGVWAEDPNNAGVYPWQDFATSTGGTWDDATTATTGVYDYSSATIAAMETLCDDNVSTLPENDWCWDCSTACVSGDERVLTAGSIDMTITNMCDPDVGGAYSGQVLQASEFNITGGTLAGTSTAPYTWTGGNVSSGITSVEFTDNGIPLDPGNTINVKINYSFTMPSGGGNMCIEVGTVVQTPSKSREACVRLTHDPEANVTYTMNAVTGVSQVNPETSAPWSSPIVTSKHQSSVLEGFGTKIADYTVTASAGYYLTKFGTNNKGVDAFYWSNLSNADWEPYYNITVTDTYYTSTGNTNKVQSSHVEVEYTPPMNAPLNPDPISGEGGFCAHLHRIHMDHLLRPIQATHTRLLSSTFSSGGLGDGNVVDTNTQKSVNINMTSSTAGRVNLKVGEYDSSGTGSLTTTYNWETGDFESGSGNSVDVDIPSSCYTSKQIVIPAQAANDPSKVYSVVYTVTTAASPVVNLSLTAEIPDNFNEQNLITAPGKNAEIRSSASGGFSNGTTSTTIATKAAGSVGTVVHPITFTISKSGEGVSTTKARDVVATDFNGWFTEKLGSITTGTDVLTVASTTGLTVGQRVYMDDLSVLGGATILAVTNATTLQLSETLGGSRSTITNGTFKFGSSWNWNFDNIVTTQTSSNLVTITADITCTKYGVAGDTGDCDLDLTKGFIT